MAKPVIFSGIQPTGNLNIGNYLGAVRNWVELQNSGKYEMYIFIADLHAMTGNMSASERREQTQKTAAELIAAGIDPTKTCLFVQSHVPQHAELAWILSTVTPLAELERMTQFKDKSQKQDKNINAGLLYYPILMVADILLYHGDLIPVGQDQIQHVELTRDTVRWFNKRYGDYFKEPKVLLTEVPKVMSLLHPEKKMSKSDGPNAVVELGDEPDVIEKKLKKAVTATEGGGKAPGVENLLSLLKQFGSKETHAQFVKEEKAGTIRYGDLKAAVADAISITFADFRTKRAELLGNTNEIKRLLDIGAKKAYTVATSTMDEVRSRVGIR